MNKSKADVSAFDAAAYYITFKDRTRREVYDKLSSKGYGSGDIDAAIQKLTEYGYINDENYALYYIKSNYDKKGRKKIAIELSQKGIDKYIIDSAFECIEIDERSVIRDMMERRYSDRNISDDAEVKRIYSYFARRGFKYENINSVISVYRRQIN